MRAIAAAFLVVAALSGGCGGNDTRATDERLTKDEYLNELTAITDDLRATVGACVNSSFTSSDCDDVANAFDETAEGVEALRPPLEVDDLHARLVVGLRESADDYRRLEELMRESENLDPIDALVKLGQAQESRTLEITAREFERRGYRLPAFISGTSS